MTKCFGRKMYLAVMMVSLILFVVFSATYSKADDDCSDEWLYSIYGEEVWLDSYIGDEKDVVIPEYIEGYKVEEIMPDAFYSCENIESVVIPEGIETIGDEVFFRCTNLKSVDLPEGLKSIGDYAFCECENLSQIELKDSINKIGAYSFNGCKNLSSVKLSEGLKSIGDYAFDGCSSLEKLDIPKSVTQIGDFAFADNTTIMCHNSYVRKYTEEAGFSTIFHFYKAINTVKAKPNSNGSITKVCKECGEENVSTIYAPKEIIISDSSCTYNKKQQKPTVVVKDSKGNKINASNYNVKYLNNINVGNNKVKPTVEVTFKGDNYSGVLSKTFTINKASNKMTGTFSYSKYSATKPQSFKLNIKASAGGLKYKSDNKNIKVDKMGTVTVAKKFVGEGKITVTSENNNYKTVTKIVKITVNPNKISVSSLKNSDLNKVTVRWGVANGVDGYQVQYSASKKFSPVVTLNVGGAKTNLKVLNNLTKGTTYYIRVRGYKTVSGKKYYATWSAVKTIKISKGKEEKFKGKPSITSQKQVNKEFKNKIIWTKVSGATGYQISYKKGQKGKWETAGSTSANSYQMDVKHGVYYYFKVRAYKQKKDGSKVYGEFGSSSKGLIISYSPVYSVIMSDDTDMSKGAVGMAVDNTGKGVMRIYSKNAMLIDSDYSNYNRDLKMIDTSALQKGEIKYLSYVDIPAGGIAIVLFDVVGERTWYDRKTSLWYEFRYDGKDYLGYSSYYYGTNFF